LLVGQQELDEKLDCVDLRQLKQRIALRSQLEALLLNETAGYVNCRLQLAGCPNPNEVFPPDTILELHRQSRGYPRLLNTLCENALIYGYARHARSITPEIIEEIAADFRLNVEYSSVKSSSAADQHATDVQQAAKTLLDLYASLRSTKQGGTNLGMIMGGGARKNEPYI
jgi:general secretion pathway protein A